MSETDAEETKGRITGMINGEPFDIPEGYDLVREGAIEQLRRWPWHRWFVSLVHVGGRPLVPCQS
jgi:hypothetical protein